MTKEIYYVYLGTNGTIETPVHLEGIYSIKKYLLKADAGKQLTKDGEHFTASVMVSSDELELWTEV